MENCINCKFSRIKNIKGSDRLRCQYYPPKVHMGAKATLHDTRFPWVDEDDWCSKWESK